MYNQKFNISTLMAYVMKREVKFDSLVSIGLHSLRFGITKSHQTIHHNHLSRVLKRNNLIHRMESIKKHIQSCTVLWIRDYVLNEKFVAEMDDTHLYGIT
jgi:hypothetical protein